VDRVSRASGDATTLVIEAGPIGSEVSAQDLTSASDAQVIQGVSIRAYRDSTHRVFMRVRIAFRTSCRTALRTSGRRIYVDVVPLEAPAARQVADASPPPGEQQVDTSNRKTPPHRVSTESSRTPADSTYSALEEDVLRRARELARVADVNALIALSAEVARRDDRLGRQQPELIRQLLADVDRYTNEARVSRLKLDNLKFTQGGSPARPPKI
jgi:hypothetical protein